MNQKSFTLIEILVVIVIIGILSAFIIVSMAGVSSKATIAKGQAFSNSLKNSLLLNLVSEWKLDGDANDSWSGGNNGTWYGAGGGANTTANYRPSSECVSGQCLDFDGTDDYISVNSGNVTLNLNNGYSLEGWAKYDDLTGNRSLLRRYPSDNGGWFIFAYRNAGTAVNYIFCAVVYTNTDNATQGLLPGNYIQKDKWYHFVLTVEANGVSKFYINGVAGNPLTPVNFLKLGGNTATSTTEFKIGGNGWLIDGLIDGVRIYDTAIPTSQIQQNYFLGLNSLYKNGGLTQIEYTQRLTKLKTFQARPTVPAIDNI
ncbi:MAG: LamG domain-containing protein [Candidatus Pacebacteria bacterium]|nr:LamG domain-containing protein [Candidatus Paceibacterota bacterium]